MVEPYYADDSVTLFHGDMREVLGSLHMTADLIVTDPPYGETRLQWDVWPEGWTAVAAAVAPSMWCFGSLRLFGSRWNELGTSWNHSQELVWQKNSGSGFQADRFVRVHELVALFYLGAWGDIYKNPRREQLATRSTKSVLRRGSSDHLGRIGGGYWKDDGTRLATSVRSYSKIYKGLHPTQKPVGLLQELIEYACPPGGTVLDPFGGSGSTAEAARLSGRGAVLIEADERYCDLAARRLQQQVLGGFIS